MKYISTLLDAVVVVFGFGLAFACAIAWFDGAYTFTVWTYEVSVIWPIVGLFSIGVDAAIRLFERY